jgi:hypothetical protein
MNKLKPNTVVRPIKGYDLKNGYHYVVKEYDPDTKKYHLDIYKNGVYRSTDTHDQYTTESQFFSDEYMRVEHTVSLDEELFKL